jgi:hypothetical protein
MNAIDFSTCTPEDAMAFFAKDGVDFETAVQLMIVAFTRAGRLTDIEPYLEPEANPTRLTPSRKRLGSLLNTPCDFMKSLMKLPHQHRQFHRGHRL